MIRVTDKATAPLKGVENNLKKVGKAATGMNKKFLGMGLGLTFFMFGVKMQLDRMLRSMFNIFQQAEGETGALIQRFNIMKASLAAISIAFFDAFAQSALFDTILTAVITIADWFLNLDERTRRWLSSSLIVFSGIVFALSLLGQALLAVFVLSGAPILATILAIGLAIGILAFDFIGRLDEMKSTWDDFTDLFKLDPDLNIFEKIILAFIDLERFLLDLAPSILAIAGAIWGGIVGGPLGAALGGTLGFSIGFGLEQEFGDILDRLRASALEKFKGTDVVAGPAGGIPGVNFTPEGIASAVGGGVILASGEIFKELIKNPMPIDDQEGIKVLSFLDKLKIENEEDEKKLKKMDEQKKAIEDQEASFLSKMDGLITSVNAIEVKPVINVIVSSGESSTTS